MKRSDKEAFVADFRERASGALVMYLTDFSGLDVKSMTALRRRLRESGADYVVAKNRLVRLALQDTDMPDLGQALEGPTGVVFGFDDVVSPAKAVTDFAREHGDRPVFKIGVLDNRLLDAGQIGRLARLPPREQLLAELAGAMQAPLGALAGALEAKLQETAGLLDAYKAKKEAGE